MLDGRMLCCEAIVHETPQSHHHSVLLTTHYSQCSETCPLCLRQRKNEINKEGGRKEAFSVNFLVRRLNFSEKLSHFS